MVAEHTKTHVDMAALLQSLTDGSLYSDLIGVPFRWGGRDLSGLDCWGLVVLFFRRIGIEVFDPLAGCDDPVSKHLEAYTRNVMEWWDVGCDMQESDVLLFDMNGNGAATHCGILVPGKRVLQTTDKLGVVTLPWRAIRNRFYKAYRHKCLA